jgi:hypothetical protein
MEDMGSVMELTTVEQEQARAQAVKLMRARLDQRKPVQDDYQHGAIRAGRIVASVLFWSKAFIPVVALLAALASSVRTVQTASEIYTASGTHPIGVIIAAIAFTLAVEGALFVLALAAEAERMGLRAQKRSRHLLSAKSVWRGVLVRAGLREPLHHHELNEEIRLGGVMLIALLFAVSANLYMGMRPLINELGAVSLQALFQTLWAAPATLQLTFIVDFAGVLFPPLMALAAGHLTARFAADFSEQTQAADQAYRDSLTAWHQFAADPLANEEGQALLVSILEERRRTKQGRKAGKSMSRQSSGLKNGTLHWTEADWSPTSETYECACGCGEAVTWTGIGRRTLYVNDAHRKRHDRQKQRVKTSVN